MEEEVNEIGGKILKYYFGSSGILTLKEAPLKIVSWAEGSDEEIVAMIKAANDGKIDLHDHWNVGDIRTIEMTAETNFGWKAGSYNWRLLDTNFKTLATPIGNQTKSNFLIGLENLEDTRGFRMHSVDTTEVDWSNCELRNNMNTYLLNAFPLVWQEEGIIKRVVNQYSKRDYTNGTVNDLFFIPGEWEGLGRQKWARTTRSSDGWIQWYQTPEHRYKTPTDNFDNDTQGACYLFRDCSTDSNRFCMRRCSDGDKEAHDLVPSNNLWRLSPHFCI